MNYSLLVIDDDEDDFVLLSTYIRQCHQNITLTYAESGIAAIQQLKDGLKPNLIVADARMPLMSGYEFLLWLKESEAWQLIPVVIWTGEVSGDDVVRYYRAGANSVMLKPNALHSVESFCKHWFELVQLPEIISVGQE